MRRNSAYCAGVLIEHGVEAAYSQYENTCKALAPYFDVKPSDQKKVAAAGGEDTEYFAALAARDNAASAFAKMITLQPKNLPLDKLLPLLWKACPLDVDFNECKAVYGCILKLFQVNAAAVSPHIPTVVNIFSQVLGKAQVAMEVRQHILVFCKQIMQQLGDKLQPSINSWPADRKAAFFDFVKGTTPLPAEINDSAEPTHHKTASDAAGVHKPSGIAASLSMSSLSNSKQPQSPQQQQNNSAAGGGGGGGGGGANNNSPFK